MLKRTLLTLLSVGGIVVLLLLVACGSEKEHKRLAESLLPEDTEIVGGEDCGDLSTTDCYIVYFRHPTLAPEELATRIQARAESKGWIFGKDCGSGPIICIVLYKHDDGGFLAKVFMGSLARCGDNPKCGWSVQVQN